LRKEREARFSVTAITGVRGRGTLKNIILKEGKFV
jgi:hypothetical protein